MAPQSTQEVEAWLGSKPPLAELRRAYPAEYEAVQGDLAEIAARGDLEALKAYVLRLADPSPTAEAGSGRRRRRDAELHRRIRRQIASEALKQLALTTTARGRPKGGRVRFNLLNGFVAQRLLFERDLERKPVSMVWFRLFWPLLWQRGYLLPLVGPKGIYCFYSRTLIETLAERIGGRSCLEIAAGDGTLSRFLADAGVSVVATDDHSWRSVRFPEQGVLRQEAGEALRAHEPEVVICSWPPAGNPFERHVFESPTVELYVVISSRHEFASGNWAAYEHQSAFAFAEDPALSRLVLPPELEAAVYVFERKAITGV